MDKTTDIRSVLTDTVRAMLPGKPAALQLDADEDLAKIGLTSLDMVNLMLTLEAKLHLTFPTSAINPQNFRSIGSIAGMLETLPAG